MENIKNVVQVGSKKIKFDEGTKVVFNAQKPITVIGVRFSKIPLKKPVEEVLFTGLKGKLFIGKDGNLDVKCDKDCIWSVDYTHRVERTEVLDPNPVAVSIDNVESVDQKIKRLIREDRLLQQSQNEGFETFEEADDFDLDDDEILPSPYEVFEQFTDSVEESLRETANNDVEKSSQEVPVSSQAASGEETNGEAKPSSEKADDGD